MVISFLAKLFSAGGALHEWRMVSTALEGPRSDLIFESELHKQIYEREVARRIQAVYHPLPERNPCSLPHHHPGSDGFNRR